MRGSEERETFRPLDYVDVKMGTESEKRFSRGNVLPLAAFPFSMTAFSVQTVSDDWFYNPRHKSFEGLRLTHCLSPKIGDYGQLLIMPQTGRLVLPASERYSSYTSECFKPNYISGYLHRYKASFELAPTRRGGVFRFRFDADAPKPRRILLLGISGETRFFERGGTVCGYTTAGERRAETELKEYFDIALDCPYKFFETQDGAALEVESDEVVMTLGTSFISYSLALSARRTESPAFDFDKAKENCAAVWEHFLGRVTVKANTPKQKARLKKFYTCLYRVFMSARIFYEVDNHSAVHINLKTGEVADGVQYTNTSLWEGVRTTYPLLSLIAPDVYTEICRAFMNTFGDTRRLPRNPAPDDMSRSPGMPAELVLCDGLLKNLIGEKDFQEVMRIVNYGINYSGDDFRQGRVGANFYLKNGYLPCDEVYGSVSETLEYWQNDYALSRVLEKYGKTSDAADARRRSGNMEKLYDKGSGYFRPRRANGEYKKNFAPDEFGGDFAECSARQAVFDVRHDIKGLNALMGGKLIERLDELFESKPSFGIPYGGESPTMSAMALGSFGQAALVSPAAYHLPYIYAETGDRERTEKLVEKIADTAFTEESYPGDDGGGALSAWYVLSCIGLYPFCPGRGDYLSTKPLFDEVKILLSGTKSYTIGINDARPERIDHASIVRGNNRR